MARADKDAASRGRTAGWTGGGGGGAPEWRRWPELRANKLLEGKTLWNNPPSVDRLRQNWGDRKRVPPSVFSYRDKRADKEPAVFNCFVFKCDPAAVWFRLSFSFRGEWKKWVWFGSWSNDKRQEEEWCWSGVEVTLWDDEMEKASKLGNKPKSTNEKKLNQIKLEMTFSHSLMSQINWI